jgi:hypothetical protein
MKRPTGRLSPPYTSSSRSSERIIVREGREHRGATDTPPVTHEPGWNAPLRPVAPGAVQLPWSPRPGRSMPYLSSSFCSDCRCSPSAAAARLTFRW